MALITPDTSAQDGKAGEVIKGMIALLHSRFHNQITRKQFLSRWAKARKALRATPQYQLLIDRVKARAHNRCEQPGCRNNGCHVHHKERVAMRPDLALRDENCIWICEPCHLRMHKK